MRKTLTVCGLVVLLLGWPLLAAARDIPSIVSTDWLEKNSNNPRLVVVDIRKVEEFKEGHIANAVNVFYGSWAITKKGLDNEVPETDDLFDLIGSAGIKPDSLIVVVGKTDAVTDLVNVPRVAKTLAYAGLKEIGVLDGGMNQWLKEKKPVSTQAVKPKVADYKGQVNPAVFAPKAEVLAKVGKATIIDVRMPDFYFGVSKLPIVDKAGHIKGAVSLPSPWIFAEGKFKAKEDLEAMAAGVVGTDKTKEMIIYCDTGRLCSGWWFVLREVLGYQNVKSYDGSMQEWGKDPATPVVKYRWE
jgi:thiosulfate/3-mercaptopyruvate sulfurtransferase